jgi:hypothetical protein
MVKKFLSKNLDSEHLLFIFAKIKYNLFLKLQIILKMEEHKMKKNLMITLFLMALLRVTQSIAIEEPSDQSKLGSEIRQIMLTYQNPMQTQDMQGKILALINRQLSTHSSGKSIMSTMSEAIHKVWENNEWVNAEKDQTYYDDNGNPYEAFNFIWDNNAWVNNSWSLITTNPSGAVTYVLMKLWTGSSWMDMAQVTYTYNNYGPLQILMQFYYGGNWMNSMKIDYFYNSQGQATEIIMQTWDIMTSAWVNDSKDSFTYDNNGWMIEELSQGWENNTWVNEEIAYSSYDGNGHETEKSVKAWNNNAWENYLQFTYSYNAQWLLEQEKCENWYNNIWNNSYLYIYQYDNQDRMIEELYQTWEAKGWVNESITNWTYDLIIGIEQNNLVNQSVSLYPNPASDKAFVCYSLNSTSDLIIKLYDFTGKLIKQIQNGNQDKGQYTIEFNTLNMPEGIYFLSIESNSEIITTQRLVVIR